MEPDESIDAIRRKDVLTVEDVDAMRAIAKQHPHDPYVWDILGDITILVGISENSRFDALACYLNAIDADPEYAQAYNSLGYWHDIAENYTLAKTNFEMAISLGAGDTSRIGLAKILAQLRRDEEAYAILDTCHDSSSTEVASVRSDIANGLLGPYVDDNEYSRSG